MRDISDTLKAAASSDHLAPISRVKVENLQMDLPTFFAGSDEGTTYYRFDFCELEDGYFRVRLNDSSGKVEYQKITDPSDASQWESWTELSGASPLTGSGVACSASGSTVRIFYFEQGAEKKELRCQTSTDGGATFGSETTVGEMITGQEHCLVTSPRPDWAIAIYEYDVTHHYYTVKAFYLEGGSWQSNTAGYRYCWLFPNEADKTISSAMVGDRALVVVDCERKQHRAATETLPAQPYAFYWRPPDFYSLIEPLLPVDCPKPASGTAESHTRVQLNKSGDRYFMHILSVFSTHSDFTGTKPLGWYAISPDGEHWSLDERFRVLSGSTGAAGEKAFVSGGYFYEVSWGAVYRAKATPLVGYSDPLDISSDVPAWRITKPGGFEAANAYVDVMNRNGQYNNHATLRKGSRLTIEGGYETENGEEYTVLGTFGIDRVNFDTRSGQNRLMLEARDNTKCLKRCASRARVYLSRSRFQSDFDASGDDEYFLTNIGDGIWELDEANGKMTATLSNVRHWALAGMDKLASFFAVTHFKMVNDKGFPGLVVNAQEVACQNCYTIEYDKGYDRLQVTYWKDGTPTGTIGNVSGTLGWSANTDYWLLAVYSQGSYHVFYSTDGVNYTYALSTSDIEHERPWTKGYIGLYACPGASNGQVEFYEFFVTSCDPDLTAEDIMKDAAVKCGIESFDFASSLEDDFGSLNTDVWTAKKGTWEVEDGQLKGYRSGGGNFYILSNVSKKDLKVEWDMKLGTSGQYGGVILRSDADINNAYILRVRIETVNAYADLWKIVGGSGTKLVDTRFVVPDSQLGETYHYTATINGNWIGLWCEDILLLSWYDESITGAGYFGFAGWDSGSNPVYFDNVRIPEFDLIVPLWTINPGDTYEKTVQTLVKAAGGWYYFKGDGALRAGVAVPSTTSFTFRDEVLRGHKADSDFEWFSVALVQGDYCYATAYDEELLDALGWRFKAFTIRQLKSAAQCYEVAQAKLAEIKRKLRQVDFVAPAQVGLEPGDRVHYENVLDGVSGDFFVSALTLNYQQRPIMFEMEVGLEEAT